MKRSNLIPITRIYDIYPKYTYSVDVKKFMDEIVDIDRANVYSKDEVIDMLTVLKAEIDIMSDSVIDGRTVTITSWKGMQKRICDLLQSRIDNLKGNNDV